MTGNGGGRRGRPAKLTPEQRREKARDRQRLHRQQKAERGWLRATNSGRIIYLEVFHLLDLLEFLVALKVLDSRDVENPRAIEKAVEEALGLSEIRARREELQADYDFVDRLSPSADPTFRPTGCDRGTVRFKVTHEVADVLDLEIDDTRGITQRLEDRLYRLYSNINALRHPDKVGIAWGHRNSGRHLYAFEDVAPEKARAAQEKFEEVGGVHRPLVRNLSSKGLRAVWRKQYGH
jgi:hypothetical protein